MPFPRKRLRSHTPAPAGAPADARMPLPCGTADVVLSGAFAFLFQCQKGQTEIFSLVRSLPNKLVMTDTRGTLNNKVRRGSGRRALCCVVASQRHAATFLCHQLFPHIFFFVVITAGDGCIASRSPLGASVLVGAQRFSICCGACAHVWCGGGCSHDDAPAATAGIRARSRIQRAARSSYSTYRDGDEPCLRLTGLIVEQPRNSCWDWRWR